jgi:hypothetical protein
MERTHCGLLTNTALRKDRHRYLHTLAPWHCTQLYTAPCGHSLVDGGMARGYYVSAKNIYYEGCTWSCNVMLCPIIKQLGKSIKQERSHTKLHIAPLFKWNWRVCELCDVFEMEKKLLELRAVSFPLYQLATSTQHQQWSSLLPRRIRHLIQNLSHIP